MTKRNTKIMLALSVPALLLAGCSVADDSGDTDGDGKISAEEMTSAAEAMQKLSPGEYKTAMELVEIEDPTLSAEEIKQAKEGFAMMSGMAPPRCLTGEEVDEGIVGMAKEMQSGQCETKSLTSNANKIDAQMTCNGPQGEAEVSLAGTSTDTSSEMLMTMTQAAVEGAEGPKKVVMKISMERTGDCSEETAEAAAADG